jgi:DNA-directed RNA polymerase subunit M/transcription elongation factor TFIIS
LDFCPECKTILKIVRRSLPTLQCPKCGYKAKFRPDNSLVGSKSNNVNRSKNEIAVIDKKELGLRTYPVVQSVCPECGMTESETWIVAVGSEGTTSSLTFFRCISCGYTRREAE